MAKTVLGSNFLVGSIQQSMLTEAQMQAEFGEGWVLMDGRDVTGSSYAIVTGNVTLPDARGQFLRGKNNGRSDGDENPDGESNLGLAQDDDVKPHTHIQDYSYRNALNGGGSGQTPAEINPIFSTRASSANTGSETRPKNITINIFIKIN